MEVLAKPTAIRKALGLPVPGTPDRVVDGKQRGEGPQAGTAQEAGTAGLNVTSRIRRPAFQRGVESKANEIPCQEILEKMNLKEHRGHLDACTCRRRPRGDLGSMATTWGPDGQPGKPRIRQVTFSAEILEMLGQWMAASTKTSEFSHNQLVQRPSICIPDGKREVRAVLGVEEAFAVVCLASRGPKRHRLEDGRGALLSYT